MAANIANKVVNLSEHARAISSTDSGRMLNDCRDLAMRRLTGSLRDMLAQVEEDLFQMAEASYDREMQTVYLDLRGKAKEKWPSIEAAFSRHFVEFFNRKMRGELGSAVQLVAVSALEMKLVDDEELSESIAVQKVAGHFKEQCEDELSMLGQRMGILLGQKDLKDEDNPMSPESVCSALQEACNELDGGSKVKLILLKQLEQHVSKALNDVYADLNTEMVRWNVLPDLKHAYRRPVKSSSTSSSTSKDGVNAPQSGSQGDAPQSAPDLFSALQQLMQTQYAGGNGGGAAQGFGGHSGSQAGLNSMPTGMPPVSAEMAGAFFESLTQIQRGGVPSGFSNGMPGDQASSEGVANFESMPDFSGLADTVNVLRHIKSSGISQGMGQLDAITIDIVAMLFDFIFDDAKIPDPIKGLVGRLQIPVLKVAMLDKTFFSSKQHPTRRLLDGISHAAIGWGQEVSQDDPLYKEIARIVEKVQDDFDTDVEIFNQLLDELEEFLGQRDEQANTWAERSADVIQQRESDSQAWIVAGQIVSRRISSTLPTPIKQFLLDHWQQVLKEVCARDGEESSAFVEAVATMDELIWSIEPKLNSDERKKLVGNLPKLLRSVHVGLDLINLAQAPRSSFFDEMVALHSKAVKAGLKSEDIAFAEAHRSDAEQGMVNTADTAPEVTPEPVTPSIADQFPVNPVGELFVTRITQNDVEIEEVALIGAAPSDLDRDIYSSRVAELRKGDWVEFRQEEGPTARTRLTWISPQRSMYLFTNPQSPTALSVSPEALAHKFRTGQAEIVTHEPLFERAVNGVLGSLQAA